jgi:hypothetical protein
MRDIKTAALPSERLGFTGPDFRSKQNGAKSQNAALDSEKCQPQDPVP